MIIWALWAALAASGFPSPALAEDAQAAADEFRFVARSSSSFQEAGASALSAVLAMMKEPAHLYLADETFWSAYRSREPEVHREAVMALYNIGVLDPRVYLDVYSSPFYALQWVGRKRARGPVYGAPRGAAGVRRPPYVPCDHAPARKSRPSA